MDESREIRKLALQNIDLKPYNFGIILQRIRDKEVPI